MGALLDELHAFVDGSPALDDAVGEAERLLAGGELLATELADPPATVTLAETRANGLREDIRRGLERYPLRVGGGLHQAEIDPRPAAAYATLTFIQRGGVYTPAELREMAEAGRIVPAWHAREALRFLVLLELWPLVFRPFQLGKIAPVKYPVALTELAERIARVKMPAP